MQIVIETEFLNGGFMDPTLVFVTIATNHLVGQQHVIEQRFSTGGLQSCFDWVTALWAVSFS